MYSKDGYKRYSKDRNNPFNIIPSGNITMEDVDFPVFAMDDLGNSQIMMPGANYTFPGNEVFEIPLVQNGNEISLELLLRQAMVESSLNPNAVSDKGAQGLTQIMEDALADYQDATGDMNIDLFNPKDAKKVQTWYMNNLYNADFINKPDQSDTVRMAKTLASYNWGRGHMFDLLTEQKNKGVDIYSDDMSWIEHLPSETKDYLNKILFDTDEDFKLDTKKYYSEEKYAPYIDLYKEQGGENLPLAQLGNIAKGLKYIFKPKKNISKINWGNWNKDIPLNKELMQEYNTIEEVTKKKGTWMKNADGTPFEGPPELFIQMQSKAFKNAYPEGITTTYRGFPLDEGPKHWEGEIINPANTQYKGVFTGDLFTARSYADNEAGELIDNVFKLASRNTDNSLKIPAYGRSWGDITNPWESKKKLIQQYNFLDRKLNETIKQSLIKKNLSAKTIQGYASNIAKMKKEKEALEKLIKNFDNSNLSSRQIDFTNWYNKAPKNPNEYFQGVYSDDIAKYLESSDLSNINLIGLNDDMGGLYRYGNLGNVLINKQVPGNFLKSLEGNVGTFDLTNPNIYKEEGGDLPQAQFGIPKWLKKLFKPIIKSVDDINVSNFHPSSAINTNQRFNIVDNTKKLNLPREKDWLFYRHTDVNDIMEDMEFPGNVFRNDIAVPTKISWFTPNSGAYTDYGAKSFRGNINPTNPVYLNQNRIYSEEFMKDLINKGHDAIIVRGRINNKSDLIDDIRYAQEVIPLDKNIITNLERIRKYGGSLPKFQNAGEYGEDGYKTVTFGANKKKYQDTGNWTEYTPYEAYNGETWRKRTYELNRDDLRYLTHKKSFLKNVNYLTGKNNTPKSIEQFIRNTNKSWRVQEIIREDGRIEYQLQYPNSRGNFRTFASGDSESGLANLNPEYVQGLKKTGKKGISQFSSWFDMTPQERKDHGYAEWWDQGFTRDLKIDRDGNTKSGWNYYNQNTPLSYKLSSVEISRLPSSIVQKYNLVGNDKMTLNPTTGEIDFLTSTGGHRLAVSQKDMKWFQNPGRLKQLATDDRFNYKEDNILDYLNNPDFIYFKDTEKLNLNPVKLDSIPNENDLSLEKTKPYESVISLGLKNLDQIVTEREDEIIKKNPYEAPVTLDVKEKKEVFSNDQENNQDIIKSNPYESVINIDEKKVEEISTDNNLEIIEQRKQETSPTLNPINVTSIDSNGDPIIDGSKQRFVPKLGENIDEKRTKEKILEDLKNTTGDDRKALYDELGWAYDHTIPESTNENKAEVVGDIMNNFQDVKGTNKYVNKSAKAILDAANKNDYTEKDLSRDLDIFEKYYGQENLIYLKDMLDKTQGPKANKGIEVLEDGKFNVKMDRLNNIIDKYYAGEQLSAAENQEIKLYDLRPNNEIDLQPKENSQTDLLVDNKTYNLEDQIYIYNQYLDSTFTSDNEEKQGNKIVDKINRIYYNQAKQKNIHVYDLLLAMQNDIKQ